MQPNQINLVVPKMKVKLNQRKKEKSKARSFNSENGAKIAELESYLKNSASLRIFTLIMVLTWI